MLLGRHLAACADCRAFDADIAAETALLRAAPLEAPAASFALPERGRRRTRLVALQGVGSMAAALAAALMLVSGSTRSTPPAQAGQATGDGVALASAPRSPDNTLGVLRAPVVRTLIHADDMAIHGAFGLSS